MKIYAVTWKYGDKAGFGIVGYYSEIKAKEVHNLLNEYGDMERVFEIKEVDDSLFSNPRP